MTALRPASSLDVAVLSPHAVVVHGVAAVLAPHDCHVAVHDLGSGRAGVRPAWADVVVVDSALLVSSGPSARAAIDDGGATVVLVRPEHADPVTASIGSSDVVLLPISVDGPTLADAVRQVARAHADVPAGAGAGSEARELLAGLSDREADVLRGIAAGCSNEEIARALLVSINTVKTYIRTAYRKIGVGRRAQAVAWVLAHDGLLPGGAGRHPFGGGSAAPDRATGATR